MNIIEDFITKIEILSNGCYKWIGSTMSNGTSRGPRRYYGNIWTGKKFIGAHIFSYELHSGKEATGDVHHTCNYSLCVNNVHLQDLSRSDHMKETHKLCSRGHDRTLSENVTKSGKCRPCQQEYNKKFRGCYPTYK